MYNRDAGFKIEIMNVIVDKGCLKVYRNNIKYGKM